MAEKPTLHLAPGRPKLDELIELYRRLTGREPTEAEIAEARAVLAAPPQPE